MISEYAEYDTRHLLSIWLDFPGKHNRNGQYYVYAKREFKNNRQIKNTISTYREIWRMDIDEIMGNIKAC